MQFREIPLNRRRFMNGTITSAAGAAFGSLARAADEAPAAPAGRKTILSFYCDDTDPYAAGAGAFRTFLDYCGEQRIAGESSLILGASRHSMTRNPSKEESAYLDQVRRAWNCGIGTHMELMTHRGLFDFGAGREPEEAIHEGLWLHEPATTEAEYERYVGNIITEGERAGIRFTGLTWPGCSCTACTRRYAELKAGGHDEPNPSLWKALLKLANQRRFRSLTVPCFFDASETKYGATRKASDREHAVFDLIPNAMDQLGSWSNSRDRVNPDYYITADGKSGIIIRHVQARAPYCLWYSHWQGLNPSNGAGWKAFTQVIERIRIHLQGQIVWMRPSDITDQYQKTGGWGFLDGA